LNFLSNVVFNRKFSVTRYRVTIVIASSDEAISLRFLTCLYWGNRSAQCKLREGSKRTRFLVSCHSEWQKEVSLRTQWSNLLLIWDCFKTSFLATKV